MQSFKDQNNAIVQCICIQLRSVERFKTCKTSTSMLWEYLQVVSMVQNALAKSDDFPFSILRFSLTISDLGEFLDIFESL